MISSRAFHLWIMYCDVTAAAEYLPRWKCLGMERWSEGWICLGVGLLEKSVNLKCNCKIYNNYWWIYYCLYSFKNCHTCKSDENEIYPDHLLSNIFRYTQTQYSTSFWTSASQCIDRMGSKYSSFICNWIHLTISEEKWSGGNRNQDQLGGWIRISAIDDKLWKTFRKE